MVAVRLDPFQNIVNVGWGKFFASLQFQSLWKGESSGSPVSNMQLPELSLSFPMFEDANSSNVNVHSTIPYHQESSEDLPPFVTYNDVYTFEAHSLTHCPFGTVNGSGDLFVDRDSNGASFWSTSTGGSGPICLGFPDGGAFGEGGVAEAAAFYVSMGWESFDAAFVSSTSHSGPVTTIITDTDNAVFLFDIDQIRRSINNPSIATFDIKFTTGDGPAPIEEHPGATEYTWTSIISTYGGASFASFPVTSVNTPMPGWPSVTETRTDHNTGTPTTVSEDITYRINLTTRSVTRI